jgi:tetratricopeptide (TPR) repeat protein
VFLARDDPPQARELLEGIARYHDDPTTSPWMKWRYLIRLPASLGERWLAPGDLAKAQGCADRCRELATRNGSRKNLAKGWRLAGEIATARRQWEAAEQALGEALAVARSVGNPTQLCKSHLAMGRLRAERGRAEQARAEHRAAREVLDGIECAFQAPGLRAARTHGVRELRHLPACVGQPGRLSLAAASAMVPVSKAGYGPTSLAR